MTVRNLSAPPGDYQLRLSADGAVAVDEPATFTFTVADSTTQNQDSRAFTLHGLQPGKGQVHYRSRDRTASNWRGKRTSGCGRPRPSSSAIVPRNA